MKRTSSMYYQESAESNDLALFAINRSEIAYTYTQPIIKALHKRYTQGLYNKEKAIDAYFRVATQAANLYAKIFTGQGYKFTVQQRFTVAVYLENYYIEQVIHG